MSTVIDKDLGWNKITDNLKKLDGAGIKVGLFGSGSSPANNVAHRGLVHEMGYTEGGIPSRPFMSSAYDKNLRKNAKMIAKWMSDMIIGRISIKKFLDRIGVLYKGNIQNSINFGIWTPNKIATIIAKGSSAPLIDEGTMLGAVKYKLIWTGLGV